MSKARDLANFISVPTVSTAEIADGAVTTPKIADGAVVTADLADGAVTAAKMGSGAAIGNMGFTPAPRFETGAIASNVSGNVWLRVALLAGRYPYRISAQTHGGWYGPGSTNFIISRDWSNTLYVGGVVKLGSQYCLNVRGNSTNSGDNFYLELLFSGVDSRSGNTVNNFESFANVVIEPLVPSGAVTELASGLLSGNPSSLGFISGPVTL